MIPRRLFGSIPQNQSLAIEFLMFLSLPKKHAKRSATLPYPASEIELLASFQCSLKLLLQIPFQYGGFG